MPLTIEQYHKFNAGQRKKVKRDELQTLLDEHLNTEGNVNSLRGIIREELNTNLTQLKADLNKSIDTKIKTLTEENTKLLEENKTIKAVQSEQQKCLERMQKKDSKNNIFIAGIPNVLNADMTEAQRNPDDDSIEDHIEIVHHVLSFVKPGISKDDYKILKNFEAREGYDRHSAKIRVEDISTKAEIFKGCAKFKQLDERNYLKKIFLKNDDPPLTRRENERLRKKMKELREAEDVANPVNRYHIKEGKLFKNGDECIDSFNINNQLFQ